MRLRATLLALCTAGCVGSESAGAPEGAAESSTIRRDSAGIEIVEVSPAAIEALPVWRLATEPAVAIGRVEGEEPYLLSRVLEGVLLEDGGVVIADGYGEGAASGEIRWFDADGVFVRRGGRVGEGPGEFQFPQVVERAGGDTLVVWDRHRQRVTVLAPDGRVVRTASALGCPPREGSQPGACYEPVGALDDGTVIMASGPPVYAEGREIGVKLGRPIELGAPLDGEWRRVAEVHQGDQFWARASIPGLAFPVIHPYPRLHGGRPKWAAGGEVVVEARSDSSDIRVHAPDGTLLRIIRLTAPPEPVTDEHVGAYRSHDWGDDPGRAATAEAWLNDSPPASTIPFFSDIRLDEAGHLWVEDYYPWTLTAGDAPRWWTVFRTDGAPLARIRMPGPDSLTVLDTGRDAVVGRVRGELDVERVVVHAIER